jgi:hypothetical protein
MTFNKKENNPNKASAKHWIDAHQLGAYYLDLESFENYILSFLKKDANNPNIKATNQIKNNLCINTSSRVVMSSLVKIKHTKNEGDFDKIPVVSMIVHPFKESHLTAFIAKELLLGIIINALKLKAEIMVVKFLDPALDNFDFTKKPPMDEDQPGYRENHWLGGEKGDLCIW